MPGHEDDPGVALMMRVRGEDRSAFNDLVDQYRGSVFAHMYRQVFDRGEAEDLTQEVFLRLFRYRKRYEPRAKFNTWLRYISQNVARNALRARRRHVVAQQAISGWEGKESNAPLSRGDTRLDSPSRSLERAEVSAVVRDAVRSLAFRQRTALELHQFQHWTYAQIAAELEMSPKAAKSLLYRARVQLRDCLRSYMDAEPGQNVSGC